MLPTKITLGPLVHRGIDMSPASSSIRTGDATGDRKRDTIANRAKTRQELGFTKKKNNETYRC